METCSPQRSLSRHRPSARAALPTTGCAADFQPASMPLGRRPTPSLSTLGLAPLPIVILLTALRPPFLPSDLVVLRLRRRGHAAKDEQRYRKNHHDPHHDQGESGVAAEVRTPASSLGRDQVHPLASTARAWHRCGWVRATRHLQAALRTTQDDEWLVTRRLPLTA
jgi:hypothetical protein